jgi:hypothetical protein
LNLRDKNAVRDSILSLSTLGKPRTKSIDDEIRENIRKYGDVTGDLWNYVTILGAQLSRPPFDPYRESIDTHVYIGRSRRIELSMPLIVDARGVTEKRSLDALNNSLNKLSENGIAIGLVSETSAKDRRYKFFQKIDYKDDGIIQGADGLFMEYKSRDSIVEVEKLRKSFACPLVVEVDHKFADYTRELIDVGVDGILVDSEKINKGERYRGKHAISIIHNASRLINSYNGQDTNLIVAGNVNNAGMIVKAIALGANAICYDTTSLIADACSSDQDIDSNSVAETIYKHVLATKKELEELPASAGYSRLRNLSTHDLRTSNLKVSLQGDIKIEGLERTHREILVEELDSLLKDKELQIDGKERDEFLEKVLSKMEV